MQALFTNPLTMVAGAALVSSPIIIHLINRMRFRRVQWAAMEFILKAQKRMKRKLIIEQLILLLLRCLLVLLVALLLSRFKWFSPLDNQEVRSTLHVVLLDDSPSMADFAGPDARSAFDVGKSIVWDKIAPAAAQSNTPQSMEVLRLSDLHKPNPDEATREKRPEVPNAISYEKLNTAQVEKLKSGFGDMQPSAMRGSLVKGLETAEEVFADKADAETLRVIHVVTDLRAIDWAQDGEALKAKIGALTASGVKVHLIDTAPPNRRKTDRTPRASDNAAIVEFRPLTRVAARYQPVEFEIRVKNFGSGELSNIGLKFFLNGKGSVITSREIASLPPGQERREVVQVQFSQVATPDKPLDRFNVVTAALSFPEDGGLLADNFRHSVIEVEEQRKVLVIEGRKDLRGQPEGDGFYLRKLFTGPLGGIKWEDGDLLDLEKKDLRQYACIYLLNVRDVSPEGAAKLEAFVKDGGGLSVFLGPNVDSKKYNTTLYRDGEGVFPVPLPDKPTDLDPEAFAKRLKQRSDELTKWVLVRDPAAKQHPAIAGLYTNERGQAIKDNEIEKFFPFIKIDRYWPVPRLGKWTTDPAVRELYCGANERPISSYQDQTDRLIRDIERTLGEAKFQRYRPYFQQEQRDAAGQIQPALLRKIELAVAGFDPLTNKQEEVHIARLGRYFDELLRDQINYGDDAEAPIREFWATCEPDLRARTQQLRDQVKFGDPLYLVKQYGAGRVAAVMTTSGDAWNDWPSGFGGASWVAVMTEMYKYLSAGKPVENRVLGAPLSASFDPSRHRPGTTPSASRFLITADASKVDKAGDIALVFKDLETQQVENRETAFHLNFTRSNEPGVYLFAFPPIPGEKGQDPNGAMDAYDVAGFAVNMDADHEGQLQRASWDDVVQLAPGIGSEKEKIHSPDDSSWVESLKQEKDDLSTRRWLFLVIVLVLAAEQAMAVRLSHHARSEDLELHSPTAAAAFAKGAPPMTTEAAPEPAQAV